jgi:hypothetical protein
MVVYELLGTGATFAGPAGVLIPLGIEQVLSNLTAITATYNMFAIFILLILSIVASQRDARFMALLIPIWAGFCMWAGWLHFVDQGTGYGILVVSAMIATMTYMQETVHERFGIAGPGNRIVKIFMFLIVLQCVVVFVNSSSIFPSDTQPIAQSNSQYTNIDLTKEITSTSGSGGLLNQIVDIISATTQIAVSALVLMAKCLISIGLFAVVLAQVFPWIGNAGVIGVAFLVVMQFAIWAMYVMFIVQVFYRPGPDPGW